MYKLLIVDDEAFERKVIRFMLKKSFTNIEIVDDATNGEDAILLAKKHKPNIIIMDIKMPEKNGLEAQQAIMQFNPNVKTIILTAFDNFNFAQNAIKLGVVDYILKPIRPDELNESITKIISLLQKEEINSRNTQDLSSASGKDPIHKAMEYINKNFNKNISLESVSEHIHLNPQYFSRYFKNNTGVNFIEYVSKLRVKEGKKLLVSTNKSISRISMDIGYIDSAYFTKVFIKYEGISPHKYRLMKRKNSIELDI
ncbi:response regulator transcription factor [Clostridium magnum]|uniref:Stage 0 sporulation protein A homolog n=1 Tax=Clostridium magnum DSM 2767 TaxID=1121326 RepID=A0A161WUW9_9CLOT|nr:response regulator [Clostridium magnum]KZL90678.1 putative response regulatory protein [Clostridium magnum DSM 2767]SHI39779.1 two component transcriptional regulator, AraC family [Clostridium magnum DSM 2767]